MPVYLKLVIDSNGQSKIVAIFMTASETEEAITKMVQAFKPKILTGAQLKW